MNKVNSRENFALFADHWSPKVVGEVMSLRDGNLATARRYCANATASGTTDKPTEARLTPNLWGFPAVPRGDAEKDIEDLLDSKLNVKP